MLQQFHARTPKLRLHPGDPRRILGMTRPRADAMIGRFRMKVLVGGSIAWKARRWWHTDMRHVLFFFLRWTLTDFLMDFHLFCSAHGVSWFRVVGSQALPRSGPASKVRQISFCNTHTLIYTCFIHFYIFIQFRTSNQSDGTLVLYSMFYFCLPNYTQFVRRVISGDVFDLQAMPVMPAAHSWMDSMVWWGNSGELWKLDLGSTHVMCFWEDEFDALKIIKGDFSKWGIPF